MSQANGRLALSEPGSPVSVLFVCGACRRPRDCRRPRQVGPRHRRGDRQGVVDVTRRARASTRRRRLPAVASTSGRATDVSTCSTSPPGRSSGSSMPALRSPRRPPSPVVGWSSAPSTAASTASGSGTCSKPDESSVLGLRDERRPVIEGSDAHATEIGFSACLLSGRFLPRHSPFRRGLAAVAWPGQLGRVDRNQAAAQVEQHRKYRVESAAARAWACRRRSCRETRVRDVAGRSGRVADRAAARPGSGREPGERSLTGGAPVRRARSGSWSKPSAGPTAGGCGCTSCRRRGRCPRSTISTTWRAPSPVTDGERVYAVFGTGQVVGDRHDGQGRLDPPSRAGVRAVRDQLGQRQLAGRLQATR